MEPTPLLDCGLGPGWHGAATRSLHRARAASCPLATLATQWRGHQHSDNTSGWPHALWPYSDCLRIRKIFRKHLVTCVDVLPPCGQCVAAAGVLQGSVLARSQDCGPAPARHGSSTQPWPPSCHHSHNYNLQHWLGSRLWPHSHLDSLFMFQVSMLIQLPARIMDYTKLCCPSPCLVPGLLYFDFLHILFLFS